MGFFMRFSVGTTLFRSPTAMAFPRLYSAPKRRVPVQICLQELDASPSPLPSREDDQIPPIPQEGEESKYSFRVDDEEDAVPHGVTNPPKNFFHNWSSITSFLPSLPSWVPVPKFLRDKSPSPARQNSRLLRLGRRSAPQIQIQRNSIVQSDGSSTASSEGVSLPRTPIQTLSTPSFPPNIAMNIGESDNYRPRSTTPDIYASSGLADAAPWTVRNKVVTLPPDGFSTIIPSREAFVDKAETNGRSNIAGSSRNGGTI